jgi:hypothetical protein
VLFFVYAQKKEERRGKEIISVNHVSERERGRKAGKYLRVSCKHFINSKEY